jgi:hypothetical protein
MSMKTLLHKSNLGVVLNMESPWLHGNQSPMSGHLILNRYHVDADGNVCLGTPDGFQGILDQVDVLKYELDQLANETVLWLAKNIALRRARFSVIANND